MTNDTENKPSILLGAGGHAKVVAELASLCGYEIIGVCSPEFEDAVGGKWFNIPIIGLECNIKEYGNSEVVLLNGIGYLAKSMARQIVFEKYTNLGYTFPKLVHPRAIVSNLAELDIGVQVCAGAVVQGYTQIGANSIINTNASIDHDTTIGLSCHIAPGSTICGDVTVGDFTFIGAGVTIVQGVKVINSNFVKAGSLVYRDI